jgi:hypothetical protein
MLPEQPHAIVKAFLKTLGGGGESALLLQPPSRDPEATQDREENQAMPDLEAPTDGI